MSNRIKPEPFHPADYSCEHASLAEELLDHGRRILRKPPHTCECDGCMKNRVKLMRLLGARNREISQQWAQAPPSLILRGMVEDWNQEQIAEALENDNLRSGR